MRSLFRDLSKVLACTTILAMGGCSEDNEAAVASQASANASTGKTSTSTTPQPKNQDDYAKQQKQQQKATYAKGSGYPGAK